MRSGVWRPAAPARNRSSREARECARLALRPGCERPAVTEPAQMPVREARPPGPKPPRWSAERRASRVIANCRYMALHTGPPARAERIGTPQLSLRDSIAFYTAPLLYF